MGPFSFADRNMFEEYYSQVLDAIYAEDWKGLERLRDELTLEQYLYVWRHLASYTRAKVPKGLN